MADKKCKKCDGSGKVEHSDHRGISAKEVCKDCDGQGKK